MRILIIALLGIFTSPLLCAQERLVLNVDLARQHLNAPVVGGSGTAAPVSGILDGNPRPRMPFSLTIVSLKMKASEPNSEPSGSAQQFDYELRFTNLSRSPTKIPIDPDRSKVFRGCKEGLQEASVSLRLRAKGRADQNLPSATWSGCHKMTASLITLRPGEWITYRGSMLLPAGHARSDVITASWASSDITYTQTPEGLTENSIGCVGIESPDRTLDF